MPKALIFLLVLFSFFLSCRKENAATLKIRIETQNGSAAGFKNIRSLNIFKDGHIFKVISADSFPFARQDVDLEKLSSGTYKFEYLNFLGQSISRKLIIKSPGSYQLFIHPDSTNYWKNQGKVLITNLRMADTLHIFYNSSGCFSVRNDSLSVVRSREGYRLIRNGKVSFIPEGKICALVKLESDLMDLPQSMTCTTEETYNFSVRGDSRQYVDGTCSMNAWKTALRGLKLESL